ncbi:MAG: GNAT family N-acetyltransferase [Acidobacteria bacterium]|nr:MAG: GNAT family N-acetyltransferase [Acidobacteriota bacterium]
MHLAARLIERMPGADDPLARAWDALPPSRGVQADLYDSWSWLRAWLDAAPEVEPALRLPAVFEGERLVAVLPLVARRSGRWEAAGLDFRPRVRAALAGESPRREVLEALAEAVASTGIRELDLPLLPERDPATPLLARALEAAGFSVRLRPGTAECLAPAGEPWDRFRRRFRKYERTVKNFSNKAARLGPLAVDSFGGRARPASAAFHVYRELHARGWKGPLHPITARHREALLAWGDRRGWSRLHVLRVAGVPAAAIIWFRVGEVAVAYSTVYDRRLAALSAGTIVMWRGLESEFAASPPALVDYLPGRGPQKDQLGPERPRLLTLCATRRRSVARLVAPVRHAASRAAASARRRLRRRRRAAVARPPGRRLRAQPAAAPARRTARRLEIDSRLELYLATAVGATSVARLRATWTPGDEWWALGEPPEALARVGAPGQNGHRPVRQVVVLRGLPGDPTRWLADLATACGQPVEANWADGPGSGPEAFLHEAPLPWPGG